MMSRVLICYEPFLTLLLGRLNVGDRFSSAIQNSLSAGWPLNKIFPSGDTMTMVGMSLTRNRLLSNFLLESMSHAHRACEASSLRMISAS